MIWPSTSVAVPLVKVAVPRLKNRPVRTWLGTVGAPAPSASSVLVDRMVSVVPLIVNDASAERVASEAETRTVASARDAQTANAKTVIRPAQQRDMPRIPPLLADTRLLLSIECSKLAAMT